MLRQILDPFAGGGGDRFHGFGERVPAGDLRFVHGLSDANHKLNCSDLFLVALNAELRRNDSVIRHINDVQQFSVIGGFHGASPLAERIRKTVKPDVRAVTGCSSTGGGQGHG